MIKLPPLFALEIIIINNSIFDYDTNISKFEEVTTSVIDYCLKSLQDIPQLHVLVMDKLKWNKAPNIAVVQLDESLVKELKSKLQVLLIHDVFNFFKIKIMASQ